MPLSTFASALAGTSGNSQTHRSSEWGRRSEMNGALQSHSGFATLNSGFKTYRDENRPTSIRSNTTPLSGPNVASTASTRPTENNVYTRPEMLALFERQKNEGDLNSNLDRLYMKGWDPENFPDNSGTQVWTNSSSHDQQKPLATGADVCWDSTGSSTPLGLVEMTETEKELFSGSVNSNVKMPPQNGKDNTGKDPLSHRKGSILNPHLGMPSPGSVRPPNNRRRDTNDMRPTFSPSNGPAHRSSRDDFNPPAPPAALIRRRTETRESGFLETPHSSKGPDISVDSSDPAKLFQAIKRTTPGLNNSPGPWSGSSPAGFSPMGQFGSIDAPSPSPATKTRPGFGTLRSQSRFKGLMNPDLDSNDGDAKREFKKPEEEKALAWGTLRGNRTGAGGSHLFTKDEANAGSGSLDGGTVEENSRPSAGTAPFGSGPLSQPQFQSAPDADNFDSGNEDPDSPSNTNPYQSPSRSNQPTKPPPSDRQPTSMSLAGLGPGNGAALSGLGTFPGLGSVGSFDMTGDRHHSSATAPMRDIPGLGGLASLSQGPSMWAPTSGLGTPTSERQTGLGGHFGDGGFGAVSDFQSSVFAGLGPAGSFGSGMSSFLTGTTTPGGTNHTSKLGSLFPLSLQEQMRARGGSSQHSSLLSGRSEEVGDHSNQPSFGISGRPGFGSDHSRILHPMDEPLECDSRPPDFSGTTQDSSNALNNSSPLTQPLGGSHLSATQRTMVMPDRMLWIYKDPSGKIQGPWTGLEMHDWHKAGFFTPELLVKKAEDPEFEPLATLIRRIGNSREPFLVPQVGIPHGPPSGQGNAWATGPLSTALPPFTANFPGFGTTLTADQQNALERRKQEEQYISARQKEHLAQQHLAKQMMQNQARMLSQPVPHSGPMLHGQPSFGSLTPLANFPSAPAGGHHGGNFFDVSFGAAGTSVMPELSTDMLNQLTLNERVSLPFQDAQSPHSQAVKAIHNQRELLKEEQAAHDASVNEQKAADGSLERLQQFNMLRESDQKDERAEAVDGANVDQKTDRADDSYDVSIEPVSEGFRPDEEEFAGEFPAEQAGQASSDTQSQGQDSAQAPSPWAKVDAGPVYSIQSGLDESSVSAPVAQRSQAVADNLADNLRSQTQTPSADTPSTSVAPWARDVSETAKGPSLKEIQEAEARKAAEQERLAAIARKAALEKEAAQAKAATVNAAPAPGLPASSTWASGAKPASPAPWSKSLATASTKSEASGAVKKTLQQIQQEEEARKQRAVASSGSSTSSLAATISKAAAAVPGKRYADLATQPAANSGSAGSGTWTTVGSSGKAKRSPITTSARPAVSTPTAASVASATSASSNAAKSKPASLSAPSASNVMSPEAALDELRKWSINELRRDLNKGINVDEFVQGLLTFPCELDIVTEAVHAVSLTMDSRHFAEQFIRKRKLADKGIFESSSATSAPKGPEGWSEVARRGQTAHQINKEEPNNFRLVAAKKRGKR